MKQANLDVNGKTVVIGCVSSDDPLETIEDVLAIVAGYGPYGNDIRFEYRAQILLADEVKKLRANNYYDAYQGAHDRALRAEKRLHELGDVDYFK